MSAQSTLYFNRLEIKYIVDRTTRTALSRDLRAFMRPDAHAGDDGGYTVRSLYFDTPDYMSYHDKMAGTAVRHKLRARAYGEQPSETPNVRLEVKSRYLNYIKKITVDLDSDEYCDIQDCWQRRRLPPGFFKRHSDASHEFFRLQRQLNMEPVILIQYRREAFERREINRVRVNFDDELVATRNTDLLGPLRGARRLLQHGHAIFEIKVDNTLPYWLHTLISKYNLQNEAVSKYCYAVRSEARLSAVRRENGFH